MRDMVQEAIDELKKKHPSREGWKYTAEELKSISEEISFDLDERPSGLIL